MSDAGFPCSELHLQEHQTTSEKIKESLGRCTQRAAGCDNCIQDNISGLLSHILMSDIDFKEYLYAQNQSDELSED